ncbi:MAG TPA: flavodoxin domain-containing protein [Candidatus Dormibacteraeota bacterium]|nr:flavodoxin domain-containing protein [Candidatus Dormibacteraeota bacterium]
MRALVVYESMYGNTARVAEAIAEGLGGATAVEVSAAPDELPPDLDLVVVGGPTHAHGMSRERSRRDAADRASRPVISRRGIRDWIDGLRPPRPMDAASFDTRINGPELLTGSAAKGAARALRGRGFKVAATESFVLDGMKGEPYDRMPSTELERARTWGRTLAERLAVGPGRRV